MAIQHHERHKQHFAYLSARQNDQAKFFVLEPSPDPGEFWNSKELQKKYVWEIVLPGREVTCHEIKLETPESWYMKRIKELLG